MRTEGILPIGVKCFEMWWPGTELNRRRQPFQGCALPPELPGHFPFAQLCPQNDWRPIWPCRFCSSYLRSHWRDAAKQNNRCAETVRNSRIITTVCPSLKTVAEDFRAPFLFALFSHMLAYISSHIFSHYESGPLGTPFMMVNAQRFAPNQ